MTYQLLVITSRINNNVGGACVVQNVLPFTQQGYAEAALKNIELAAKQDKTHSITVIRLY